MSSLVETDDHRPHAGQKSRCKLITIIGRIDTWWFETLPVDERRKAPPFRTPRFHRPSAVGSLSSAERDW
jgi:hypothetical protein